MNTPSREHPPPKQSQDYPGRTADMDPAPATRCATTIAPSFVFFASGRMSSYYSGEVLAPVGGETLPTR